MQSLAAGLYAENFFYGYPYDNVVDPLPSEFDYEGAALTNAGQLTCLPGDFTLEYGTDPAVNPDAGLAYGGAPDSNDYYLRFPALSWEGIAGLFLTVQTSAPAVLTFDRAWSGYVGDTFSVVANGMELQTVTGSAGYPWTRSSITLPAGRNELAFVLNCAPYSASTVRGGVGQASSVVDLFRYLRITNLSITNVAQIPTADNQRLAMIASTSLTDGGNTLVSVTSGKLAMAAQADLLWPKKLSGPLTMRASASLSTGAGSFVGKYGRQVMLAQSSFAAVVAVENDVRPSAAGFGITGSAQLSVESSLAPAPQDYLRPLMTSKITMKRPVFVAGRPVQPVAVSETEVTYSVQPVVLSKIDPASPANQLPVAPTYRWLSLGAHVDPVTDQLLTWFDTTGAGPSWTQPGLPGVYAPTVDHYSIKNRHGVQTVNYPAVHFDAMHGDHLLADLPVGSGLTFVLVGTFARYRGALDDSCPILDYAGSPAIDYTRQLSPVRGVLPWAQSDTDPSIFLGLVPANRQEPTVSKLAYAAGGYRTSDDVVINDNTPMVLVYSVGASGSFLMATPLITGQSAAAARMTAQLPGAAPAGESSFALGRARRRPPQNGTFSTATMSLLEVAYYEQALTLDAATMVSDFLVGLYSPVDQSGGPTTTALGTANLDTEQMLVYANAPEQPIALLSGSKTTVTDWYLSDSQALPYVTELTNAGIPLALLSNRDYTALITAGEQTR